MLRPARRRLLPRLRRAGSIPRQRASQAREPRRRPEPLLALCALFVLSPLAPAGAQQAPRSVTTIERIVAVVDERPLLLSELRAIQEVRGLSEAAALEALVDERLMFVEAARLPQAEVLAEEELQAAEALLARRPELALRVSAPELRRLVARQATILKYVEFRFRPQLRVSEQEVRAAFETDPAAGPSWEAAKDRLRDELERRALDERVEEWVRELRARADVRYVGRGGEAAAP